MKKLFSILTCIFLFVFLSKSQSIPNSINKNDKLYYLSLLWSEIKYNFVNIDQLEFNIDSLYYSYIPKVQYSKNDFEYYQLLKKFVASFKDGHTEVFDGSQFRNYMDYFPMRLKDVKEKVYIVSVLKSHKLDSTWVGAEVIKISGIETKKFLKDSIFPYVSASTKQNLWMQGVSKIHQDFKWKDFNATIIKTTGDSVEIKLQRNGEATRTPKDEHWGMQFSSIRKRVYLQKLKNGITYLNIKSFYPDKKIINQINNLLPEIYKSKGLIIDLRKNGGGSTNTAWYLESLLLHNESFLNYAWETRINDGVKKANSNWKEDYKAYFENREIRHVPPDTINIPDSIVSIRVPVVILIGRYTFSAAEDFLVNLYEIPNRPIFIGQETGGSTGSPLVIRNLPNGGYCRVCTRRICYPYSRKKFVNTGVVPDIFIEETIEDIINNNDVVLNKAVDLLSDKLSQKN
ncbi:MAG: S41 family peptidase [Bacteroidales bacterium]|nr:S41 family peptidase [Bacteroidales bacterium]